MKKRFPKNWLPAVLLLYSWAVPAIGAERCVSCDPPTKLLSFNVVCYFKELPDYLKRCKVGAKFIKRVTVDGAEVQDDSREGNLAAENPALEVSCNDAVLYNGSSHRYTDLLGTRIQGESGPHPAVILPRGVLHGGPDDRSGNHTADAILELDVDSELITSPGICYIWAGYP